MACATFGWDRTIVSRGGPFSWWDRANVRGKAFELVLLLNCSFENVNGLASQT